MKTRAILQKIRDTIPCDQAQKNKDGTFTVRREFFYRHGKLASDYQSLVMAQAPAGTVLIDSGEVEKPFVGGAPTHKSSHWWVKIKLPDSELTASQSSSTDNSKLTELELLRSVAQAALKIVIAEHGSLDAGVDWLNRHGAEACGANGALVAKLFAAKGKVAL